MYSPIISLLFCLILQVDFDVEAALAELQFLGLANKLTDFSETTIAAASPEYGARRVKALWNKLITQKMES